MPQPLMVLAGAGHWRAHGRLVREGRPSSAAERGLLHTCRYQVNVATREVPGMPGEQGSLLVTVEEGARMLGIGRSTMFELIATGRLRTVKIGRCRRVSVTALRAFVDDLEQATGPTADAPSPWSEPVELELPLGR